MVVSRKGWQSRGGSQENREKQDNPPCTSIEATCTKVQLGKQQHLHSLDLTDYMTISSTDRKGEPPKDNVAKVTTAGPSHRHQGMTESRLGGAGIPYNLHGVP